MRTEPTFIVLSIAGSDPTGGAGVQGDLKTFAAHGVAGTAVVTAVTAQNHGGVRAIHAIPPAFVAAQLDALFDQVVPRAAKTGMLHSVETVAAVAELLRRRPVEFLVVDPVLAATAGGSLAAPPSPGRAPGLASSSPDAVAPYVAALASLLLPLATLVTPNLAEAGALLGRPVGANDVGATAVELFRRLEGPAVLVKGGHGTGPESVDALATTHGVVLLAAPRIATVHGHGTGCALSASIVARLARGDRMEDAMRGAKAYLGRALAAARALGVGRGPIAHDVAADLG